MRTALYLALVSLATTVNGAFAQEAPSRPFDGVVKVRGATVPDEDRQTPPPSASRIPLGDEGFLEFHFLLQAWFLQSLDSQNPYVRPERAHTTFLIRRSELKFAGDVIPQVGFEVMIDPSRVLELGSRTLVAPPQNTETIQVPQPVSSVTMLQDAFVTFKFVPDVGVSVGQGHTPISHEGLQSSSDLLFVERADVSRLFGDQRDIGVWVKGRAKRVRYTAGLFNGSGASHLDVAPHKDFAARLEHTLPNGLGTGASVLRTLAGDGPGTHTVAGGDAFWKRDRLTVTGELYWQQSVSSDQAAIETERLGSFLAVAYLIAHTRYEWQVAGRVDWFDPSRNRADDDLLRITGGLNILLKGNRAKVQVNFTHTQATHPGNNNLILLNSQVAF